MIGLDCNVLVQLAIADHPANARTLAAVESETQRGTKLVFPSLVATEFLHVVTDERRFVPPLTMPEALDWMQDFLANPSVSLLEPTQASMDQTLRWMRQFNLGRKRILDTHLAAILHTSGFAACLRQTPPISRSLAFWKRSLHKIGVWHGLHSFDRLIFAYRLCGGICTFDKPSALPASTPGDCLQISLWQGGNAANQKETAEALARYSGSVKNPNSSR